MLLRLHHLWTEKYPIWSKIWNPGSIQSLTHFSRRSFDHRYKFHRRRADGQMPTKMATSFHKKRVNVKEVLESSRKVSCVNKTKMSSSFFFPKARRMLRRARYEWGFCFVSESKSLSRQKQVCEKQRPSWTRLCRDDDARTSTTRAFAARSRPLRNLWKKWMTMKKRSKETTDSSTHLLWLDLLF